MLISYNISINTCTYMKCFVVKTSFVFEDDDVIVSRRHFAVLVDTECACAICCYTKMKGRPLSLLKIHNLSLTPRENPEKYLSVYNPMKVS